MSNVIDEIIDILRDDSRSYDVRLSYIKEKYVIMRKEDFKPSPMLAELKEFKPIGLIGRSIEATDVKGRALEGEVLSEYMEALASGTNEYVTITLLLVWDEERGQCFEVRPRDVTKVLD